MGRYAGEDYPEEHYRQKRDAARISALERILADRERELLAAKGPCRNEGCKLHCAHSGPCNVARKAS